MSSFHLVRFFFTALMLGLTACGPGKDAAAPAAAEDTTPGDAATGQRVYLRVCFVCHQPNGLGVPDAFPPLAGSTIVAGDPDRLIRIVLHGLQGPVEVNGTTFNSVMPAQGTILKDFEIANVLTYVRSAWGNHASPVSVEAVTQVRSTVKRDAMWTWAELTK